MSKLLLNIFLKNKFYYITTQVNKMDVTFYYGKKIK